MNTGRCILRLKENIKKIARNTKSFFWKILLWGKGKSISATQDSAKEGCSSKRMGETDLMKGGTLEKEEELCRALSNFSITLNDFSMKKQFIKPPKLQVGEERDPI